MAEDPLFWIHLNVDYPFSLTGVLYFPKVKNDFEVQKNKIQLYSRQVFITDEVKDVVPDFLMLLHGVLDSPDIPLNVSRSYLQSDASVKKISQHITKKVADKLQELFKKDRTDFEKKWDDINIFVKYGIISDEKFYDRAKEFSLLKNVDEKYFTFDEYKEKVKTNQTDKDKNLVYLYASDQGKQDSFIQGAKSKSYDVLVFDGILDSHFINTLEQKLEKTQLKRVDSDTLDKLISNDEKVESILSNDDQEKIKGIFEKAINNKNSQASSASSRSSSACWVGSAARDTGPFRSVTAAAADTARRKRRGPAIAQFSADMIVIYINGHRAHTIRSLWSSRADAPNQAVGSRTPRRGRGRCVGVSVPPKRLAEQPARGRAPCAEPARWCSRGACRAGRDVRPSP
jgi:HSP90 family molecular chaperone